jgi:hypothetical protein
MNESRIEIRAPKYEGRVELPWGQPGWASPGLALSASADFGFHALGGGFFHFKNRHSSIVNPFAIPGLLASRAD